MMSPFDDYFTLEEKTKYVVEFNSIGLGLGDLKDIMDKNTKRS